MTARKGMAAVEFRVSAFSFLQALQALNPSQAPRIEMRYRDASRNPSGFVPSALFCGSPPGDTCATWFRNSFSSGEKFRYRPDAICRRRASGGMASKA